MSLLYGLFALHQSAAASKPHILGFNTARTVANDLLLELWNGATAAGIKAAVDLNGKYYSAALTAGDILYAVAGGVSNVKRLDSLAIGTAEQVLTVNAGGTAPEWASLTGLGLTAANIAAGTFPAGSFSMPTFAVTSGLTLTGATITGAPTWSSTQSLNTSGLAGTATALATARAINGVDFDGTAAITVTAAAGTLSGATLKSTVLYSSLTVLGTLSYLYVGASGITSAGQVKATLTTQQLALHYDINNHLAVTVGSAGAVTYNATGTSAGHSFSDLVTAAAGLTVTSGQTLTVTGVTVTGLGAASVAAGTFPSGAFTFQGAVSGVTTLGTSGLITASGGLTVASGQTLTVTGATITGLTAASVGAGTFAGAIVAGAGLTITSGQTLTVTSATITGLTAASVAAGTFPSGGFVFQGALSGITTIAVGTTPAAAGVVRLPNNANVSFRNAADGADVVGLYVDTNNYIHVGASATRVYVSTNLYFDGITGYIFHAGGGSVAAPEIALGNSTDTGVHAPDATSLSLVAGGDNVLNISGSGALGALGFYETAPQAKPTITGSRGSNAALASLLTALATLGLVTDSTS